MSKSVYYTASARNNIIQYRDIKLITWHQDQSYTLQILFVNQVTWYYIVCSLTSRSIPVKSFMMSVRHIHTQAQALAELERQRAAQRASYIRWKETMLNDPEYHEQLLQSWKIGRDQK